MKQVFLEKGSAVVDEVPVPLIDDRCVMVDVYYSFISSGTEAATLEVSGASLVGRFCNNVKRNVAKLYEAVQEHGIAGTITLVKKASSQSLAVGYSCSGRVIAVGKHVTHVRIGDYVACAGSGYAYHAQCVIVPHHLVARIPSADIVKNASAATIGAIALHGLRRADVRIGDNVCVIGLGLLGQFTVQLARAAGANVIGIDIDNERCTLSRDLGCNLVINARTHDAAREIAFYTHHYGVDATIITASSSENTLISQAVEYTRRKGKVVVVGDVKLDIAREPLYQKEIDVLISCSYGPGRYDPSYEFYGIDYPYAYVRWTEQRNLQLIVDQIACGTLRIDPLISAEFSIEKASVAYEALRTKKMLGIVMRYQEGTQHNNDHHVSVPLSPSPSSMYQARHRPLNAAVVGLGGFTQLKLLPILRYTPDVTITHVVDTDINVARTTARMYTDLVVGNDYRMLIDNPDVDLVVVATPHALHACQALDLLRAGKAIFVEKPAAIDREQLAALEHYFSTNNNPYYTVDFNRSWSPFINDIKAVVDYRTTPLVMTYRMNVGWLPLQHWIQSSEHGGRIIGEACHIFELFIYLVQARPTHVSVSTMGSGRSDMAPTDNVTAQITFADGSSTTLIYTALGNSAMPKERLEIFVGGISMVMEDFVTLTGYGLPTSFNKAVRTVDKGHQALIEAFVAHARDGGLLPVIPYERIMQATMLSIIVDELARQGGGSVWYDQSDVGISLTPTLYHSSQEKGARHDEQMV